MSKYNSYGNRELIERIEELERQLEKTSFNSLDIFRYRYAMNIFMHNEELKMDGLTQYTIDWVNEIENKMIKLKENK